MCVTSSLKCSSPKDACEHTHLIQAGLNPPQVGFALAESLLIELKSELSRGKGLPVCCCCPDCDTTPGQPTTTGSGSRKTGGSLQQHLDLVGCMYAVCVRGVQLIHDSRCGMAQRPWQSDRRQLKLFLQLTLWYGAATLAVRPSAVEIVSCFLFPVDRAQ